MGMFLKVDQGSSPIAQNRAFRGILFWRSAILLTQISALELILGVANRARLSSASKAHNLPMSAQAPAFEPEHSEPHEAPSIERQPMRGHCNTTPSVASVAIRGLRAARGIRRCGPRLVARAGGLSLPAMRPVPHRGAPLRGRTSALPSVSCQRRRGPRPRGDSDMGRGQRGQCTMAKRCLGPPGAGTGGRVCLPLPVARPRRSHGGGAREGTLLNQWGAAPHPAASRGGAVSPPGGDAAHRPLRETRERTRPVPACTLGEPGRGRCRARRRRGGAFGPRPGPAPLPSLRVMRRAATSESRTVFSSKC